MMSMMRTLCFVQMDLIHVWMILSFFFAQHIQWDFWVCWCAFTTDKNIGCTILHGKAEWVAWHIWASEGQIQWDIWRNSAHLRWSKRAQRPGRGARRPARTQPTTLHQHSRQHSFPDTESNSGPRKVDVSLPSGPPALSDVQEKILQTAFSSNTEPRNTVWSSPT